MKNKLLVVVLIFNLSQLILGQQRQVRGTVFVDFNSNGLLDKGEKPLPKVAVSNGIDLVMTNKQGKYNLQSIAKKPIFIIKPSGYISPLSKSNTAKFYYLTEEIQSASSAFEFNFPLVKNPEYKSTKAVLLGDVQVNIIDDLHHVGKLVVSELAKNPPDFIVPLGDLSFDNLAIFPDLSNTLGLIGSPVFYVMGNHDIDTAYNDFEDRDASFKKNFGPSYYAFEFGKKLYLVLNTNYPTEKNKYIAKIDKSQLQFVSNLAALKNKSHKTLTIFMHIPFEELTNKTQLMLNINAFDDIFIVAGHTHTQYHSYIKRSQKKAVHQLVAGAVCGAWWQGPRDSNGIPFSLMYDGTPKGYWWLLQNTNNYKLSYKVSGKNKDKQIQITVPEYNKWDTALNSIYDNYIYDNVFAADKNTKVEYKIDSDNWKPMTYYEGISPQLKRLYTLQQIGRYKSLQVSPILAPKIKSKHLWKAELPISLKSGFHKIEVRAYNPKLGLKAAEVKVYYQSPLNKS
ncbi:MAG: calcineurin-like phosphoesterase C-terminal domain-containing protein [Tenacibaculum sp.]